MADIVLPGVFIEESSFRPRAIEGVPTGIAGLIGPLRRGPLRGAPVAVRSLAEFERTFGDATPLAFDSGAQVNYVAHAARLFFANGGRELRVVRVARRALAAERLLPSGAGRFVARDPGAAGAFRLELRWRSASPPAAPRFDLVVHDRGASRSAPLVYLDLDPDPAGARHPSRVLARRAPAGEGDASGATVPVLFEAPRGAPLPAAAAFVAALRAACDAAPAAESPPRFELTLAGGSDGAIPGAPEYAGASDAKRGSTGYAALAEAREVALVAAPAAAASPEVEELVALLRRHCHEAGGRLGIVDAPRDLGWSELRARRAAVDDDRIALWHPWLLAADSATPGGELPLPPSCFLTGVVARTEVGRGAHASLATEPIVGALRPEVAVDRVLQDGLVAESINVLQSQRDGRVALASARTLASGSELRYVAVRRLLLFLARSIESGTQWVVFEPNGPALWAAVQSTLEEFLDRQWRDGALVGSVPREAYFVRCDRTTMTQDDVDQGRLIALVGVAPVKPAEFVIFRIGQFVRGSS